MAAVAPSGGANVNLYKSYLEAAAAPVAAAATPAATPAAVGHTGQSSFTKGGVGDSMLADDRKARSTMKSALGTALAQISSEKFTGQLTPERFSSLVAVLNQKDLGQQVISNATGRIHNAWWAANPSRVLGNKADLGAARHFALPVDLKTIEPNFEVFSTQSMKEMAKAFVGEGTQAFAKTVRGNNESAALATFGALRAVAEGLPPLQEPTGYTEASKARWAQLSQPGETKGKVLSTQENVGTAARLISDLGDVKQLLETGGTMAQALAKYPEATNLVAQMHDTFVGFRLTTNSLYDDSQKVPADKLDPKVLSIDIEPLQQTLAAAVELMRQNAPVNYL